MTEPTITNPQLARELMADAEREAAKVPSLAKAYASPLIRIIKMMIGLQYQIAVDLEKLKKEVNDAK